MSTALVRRPTENAALAAASGFPRLLPSDRVADLLIVARVMGDKFGQRHFGLMLDRALGIEVGE